MSNKNALLMLEVDKEKLMIQTLLALMEELSESVLTHESEREKFKTNFDKMSDRIIESEIELNSDKTSDPEYTALMLESKKNKWIIHTLQLTLSVLAELIRTQISNPKQFNTQRNMFLDNPKEAFDRMSARMMEFDKISARIMDSERKLVTAKQQLNSSEKSIEIQEKQTNTLLISMNYPDNFFNSPKVSDNSKTSVDRNEERTPKFH